MEKSLEALSDAQLLSSHLAGGGQPSAFIQELFRRYYERVVTWCLRIAGDREEAHDLAQGIFVKAQRYLATYRAEAKVSTWLYAITRSECVNYLRWRSARKEEAEEELSELADEEGHSPDVILEKERSATLVRSLLDEALDETEKKVFVLHYGDEMPLDAITRLLALSNRSGAKAYIVSARRKLARAVQRWQAQQERYDA